METPDMKKMVKLRVVLAAIACVGMMVPQVAWSADGLTNAKLKLVDVQLQDGKVLQGQIVDGQGKPQADADVAVLQDGKVLARTKTNKEGYFAVRDLKTGIYQVASDNGLGNFRVWNADVAPPQAQQGALVVADGSVVRGNLLDVITNPLVVAGVIATAIAVPIAVSSSNNSGS
jgi:hypothetical protein